MSDIEIYDKPVVEVICGDRMHACRCGLAPLHDGPHKCAEPDPQCGGSWADHEDPDLAWVIRYPGVRAGGPNEGFGDDPDEPVAEPRLDPPDPLAMLLNAPRGAISFFPPPLLGIAGFDA
jgi:hypothetical protein